MMNSYLSIAQPASEDMELELTPTILELNFENP